MSAPRQGFVLIATLWLLVAISVALLELGLYSRLQRRAAANAIEGMQARAAAEAGLARVRARLDARLGATEHLENGPGDATTVDPWGRLDLVMGDTAFVQNGMGYRVRLIDLGSRLNLNTTTEEGLRRFLDALRIDGDRADRIAQATADWRDADDLHRARGAESDWYVQHDRQVLPRNGPFQSVEEFRYVKDVTPQLFMRIEPYLTVRGTGRVNLETAPRPVLLALPGMGEEAVAVLESMRRQGQRIGSVTNLGPRLSAAARLELLSELPRLLPRVIDETEEVEVNSEGRIDGSPVRVMAQAVVVRVQNRGYEIWRRTRP